MTWFEIAETGEWTQDRDLYEGAIEAGMSACEFDEDDLQRRCVRLEAELIRYRDIVHSRTMTMMDTCEAGQETDHPLNKNSHFFQIHTGLRDLRKVFDL